MSRIGAGIDIGSRCLTIVLVEGGEIILDSVNEWVEEGTRLVEFAASRFGAALDRAGIRRSRVARILATGAQKEAVSFADDCLPEPDCCVRGTMHYISSARTIVAAGFEVSRAVACDGNGRILKQTKSDLTAFGTGAFIDAMARALDVNLDGMVRLSLEGRNRAGIGCECGGFADPGVATLINGEGAGAGITRSIQHSIASRVASLLAETGTEDDVVLVGGLAHNGAFVESFREIVYEEYRVDQVRTLENPIVVGALGAALYAANE